MTCVWRIAWLEQRDGVLSTSEGDWRDTEAAAEALAEEVVRTRAVLGQVLVYSIELGATA